MRISALFLFLFLSSTSYSQDCKLNVESDHYTKEKKISTGFIMLENASLTIDADKREIDVFFSIEGVDKCYDNNSTAVIFFEGTKVKLTQRNAGTMNCNGYFHFIFKNAKTPNSTLKKIMEKKITQVVFTGNNKKETILTLAPSDQETLIRLSNCLVKEAANLLN